MENGDAIRKTRRQQYPAAGVRSGVAADAAGFPSDRAQNPAAHTSRPSSPCPSSHYSSLQYSSSFAHTLTVIALVLSCALLAFTPAAAQEASDPTVTTEPEASPPAAQSATSGAAAAGEAAGRAAAPRIRSVKIEIVPIFDEPGLPFFYRAVNSLKIQTREEVVQRELLFKEGDTLDEFILSESERNLRSLPFLREVAITPIREGDVADVIVRVQDTWTLYPFLNFSFLGGTNETAIGLHEGNLLGYGKRVELLVADDEGRQKVEGVWDDRRVLGTQNRLVMGYFDRSDGYRGVASLGRPLRTLVDPYAWNVNADVFDLVGRLFEGGDERFIFRQKQESASGSYTFSRGTPEEMVRRYTVGYNYTNQNFTQADEDDFEDIDLDPNKVENNPEDVPDDRRFSGPYVGYQQIEPDYLSINFVDRFERVQDFNLGNEFNASAQYAPEALGSLGNNVLVRLSDSDGFRVTPTSFVRAGLGTSFRGQSEGLDNFLLTAGLRYYNVLGAKFLGDTYIGKHTIAAAVDVDYGEDLDKDFELLLGASNGLRGYEDRAFSGDQRFLFNLEDRFHLVEDVLKLVDIGGAFFLDAGGTSRRAFGDIFQDNFYANVGVGLRFGMIRSSGGTVVRVDLAIPLRDGPDDSQRFEPRVLISTGQAFSSGLSSEGDTTPTVSSFVQ